MGIKDVHPSFPELLDGYKKGKVSRREFMRFSALIGVATATAASLGGFALPTRAMAATPKRGGVMKVSAQLIKITHPSQFSWIAPTNVCRQVAEYLTITGNDNITRPYLAEKWSASPDLTTWTFDLRQGIKFNNGDPFTASDVVFTIEQWLTPEVKSSILGLMGGYLDKTGIEKVNDYQIKLHLKKPEIAVPEHFFHYPAMILNHKTFEGDFLKAPHGTGPYTLESYKEGEVAILKARQDYWQMGSDGKPLPYMDGIKFIDMGGEMAPQIAALKSGEIDMIDNSDSPGPQVMEAVKDDKNIEVLSVATGITRVLRARVDLKPWTDIRVMNALKLCQHREKILALAYQGQGLQGQDVHVYPNHPEYCKINTPAYDPAKAKQLLTEAGYPDGIDINLAVCSEWTDIVRYAEVLKEDAAPAGFRINIMTMSTNQYWEKWTEFDLGVTPWTHRSLGTMILNLAYTADKDGKPVPWNETRWVDKEFIELLGQANATLDVDKRREIMCKLEAIQQERGPIGIAYWMNTWFCPNKKMKGVQAHPTNYMLFNEVWMDA